MSPTTHLVGRTMVPFHSLQLQRSVDGGQLWRFQFPPKTRRLTPRPGPPAHQSSLACLRRRLRAEKSEPALTHLGPGHAIPDPVGPDPVFVLLLHFRHDRGFFFFTDSKIQYKSSNTPPTFGMNNLNMNCTKGLLDLRFPSGLREKRNRRYRICQSEFADC